MSFKKNRNELQFRTGIILGALLSTQVLLSFDLSRSWGATPRSQEPASRRHSVSSGVSMDLSFDVDEDFQRYMRALNELAGGFSSAERSAGFSSGFLSRFADDRDHYVDPHEFKRLVKSYIEDVRALRQSRSEAQRVFEQAKEDMKAQGARLIDERLTSDGYQFNQKEFQFKPQGKNEVKLKSGGVKAFLNRILKTHETGDRAKAEKARQIFKGLVQTQGRIDARVRYLQEDQDLLEKRIQLLVESIERSEDKKILLKEILSELSGEDLELIQRSPILKELNRKYQKMGGSQVALPPRIRARKAVNQSCSSLPYTRSGQQGLLQGLGQILPVLQRAQLAEDTERLDRRLDRDQRLDDEVRRADDGAQDVFDDEAFSTAGSDEGRAGEEEAEEDLDGNRKELIADHPDPTSEPDPQLRSRPTFHLPPLPPPFKSHLRPPPPPFGAVDIPGSFKGRYPSVGDSNPGLENQGERRGQRVTQVRPHVGAQGDLSEGRLTRERVDQILSRACLEEQSQLEYVDCMLGTLKSLRGKIHVD